MVRAAPKQQPNRLFWIVFVLVALGAILYVYTGDEAAAPAVKRNKPKPKAEANSGFLEEDYKTKFSPVTVAASDVFRPLVVKAKGAPVTKEAVPTRDGAIPEAFTGEPGWAYTGYVEVNGRPQALLENDATGEGVYVNPGQPFKKSRILSFTENTMVVMGPTRVTRSIRIGGEEPEEVTPIAPLISGPIGGVAAAPNVQPLPAAIADDGSQSLQRPRRNRNRNRN